jgi:hypothetical protein
MREALLPENCKFQIESFDEMTNRFVGFGENLFRKLLFVYPAIVEQIKFYKRVDFQLEDSYAIITNMTTSIAIQLDPLCEVIILWNNEVQIEKGRWTENLLDETIESINTLLHRNK